MDIRKFSDYLNEEVEIPGMSGNKVDSWVNIKVDRDLPIRISRYAKALDVYVQREDLKAKLEILSNPIGLYRKYQYGVQCKLSIVLLLQYLKEIKNNFEASSAGFLFEDYIAGLLHQKRVGGYSKSDFNDNSTGVVRTCQIKFYTKSKGQIELKVEKGKEAELLDYYIIGLKGANEAYIWIIDDKGEFRKKDYIDPYYFTDSKGKLTKKIAYYKINATKLKADIPSKKPFVLDYGKIDNLVNTLTKEIRESVDKLYSDISELNYNIETIITGISKEQDVVSPDKIDDYYTKAEDNIKSIGSDIEKLKVGIKGDLSKRGIIRIK